MCSRLSVHAAGFFGSSHRTIAIENTRFRWLCSWIALGCCLSHISRRPVLSRITLLVTIETGMGPMLSRMRSRKRAADLR
jgi:hypothetical protein